MSMSALCSEGSLHPLFWRSGAGEKAHSQGGMRSPTSNSSHGVSSSAHITPLAALHDPAGATDKEVVEWVLLIWRGVSATAALRQIPTHTAVMDQAAFRIFGRDSLQSAAALKRRYRQLAIRVHPDKNPSSQASEAFQVLQSCFEHAIHSREAGGSGYVDFGEQPAFQRPSDSSMWQKGSGGQKCAAGSSETAKPHFSSSTSSSTASSSPSLVSPPLSPVFSSCSSSSSNRSSPTRPRTAAAAATAGRAPPPRPSFSSHLPTPSAASASRGSFLSAVMPEPPNVFATNGGAAPAATVPASSALHGDSSDPVVPPPLIFGAQPTFQSGSTGAVVHRTRRRAFSDRCTSSADAAKDFGSAPPLVFEHASSTPTDTSTDDMVAGRKEVAKQHSSQQQQQQCARRPELPTLAELLAELDADDDDDEGGSESTAEWTQNSSYRDGLVGSAAWRYRTHETPVVTSSVLPTWPLPSTMYPSTGCFQRRAINGDDREGSRAPVSHYTSTTKVPVHLDVLCAAGTSSVPSSTPSTTAASYGALRKEVRDARYYHTSSLSPFPPHTSSHLLVGSSVHSRRAGGGVIGGGGSGATGGRSNGSPEGGRCACGKAPCGRCFLCE
ncbi:DnaJ domain containing protein [Leishmania braziliensis]|nr:DnaJ domain containing protein [Leishmania braziliensis]